MAGAAASPWLILKALPGLRPSSKLSDHPRCVLLQRCSLSMASVGAHTCPVCLGASASVSASTLWTIDQRGVAHQLTKAFGALLPVVRHTREAKQSCWGSASMLA